MHLDRLNGIKIIPYVRLSSLQYDLSTSPFNLLLKNKVFWPLSPFVDISYSNFCTVFVHSRFPLVSYLNSCHHLYRGWLHQ